MGETRSWNWGPPTPLLLKVGGFLRQSHGSHLARRIRRRRRVLGRTPSSSSRAWGASSSGPASSASTRRRRPVAEAGPCGTSGRRCGHSKCAANVGVSLKVRMSRKIKATCLLAQKDDRKGYKPRKPHVGGVLPMFNQTEVASGGWKDVWSRVLGNGPLWKIHPTMDAWNHAALNGTSNGPSCRTRSL